MAHIPPTFTSSTAATNIQLRDESLQHRPGWTALHDGNVTFRWRDSAHGNKKKLMTLPVDEFLRRFLLHLLPRGFVRIRHFGFLANRQRARLLPICFELLRRSIEQAVPAKATFASQQCSSWSCPLCGATMLIVERISAAQLLLRSPPQTLRCAV
jgi:hypothetical protein